MSHRYASATLALSLMAGLSQAQVSTLASAAQPITSTPAASSASGATAPLLGRDVLRSAMVLHDKGDYAAAIGEYLRVPASDSAFAVVQAELAMSYWANKQHAEAVAAAQRAIDLGMRSPMPYVGLGNAQEDLGQVDKALQTYEAGLKRYPLYPLLWYNQGVTQAAQPGQTAAAVASLQRGLEILTAHPNGHLQLARVELQQGHLAHGLLGLITYLALVPDGSGSQGVLAAAEELSSGTLEIEPQAKRPSTSANAAFEELDQLIGARVALGADYKSKVRFKANVVKQLQLLVEKFPVDAASPDFWQRAYGPMMEELRRGDNLTAFTYLILSSANDQSAAKWVKSNQAKVEKMMDTVRPKLLTLRDFQTVQRNGKAERVEAWFYDSGQISGLGNASRDAAGKAIFEGPWQIFDENGNLSGEGSFVNGQRVGLWRYYHPNGTLFREANYNNQGKRQGQFREYHDTGKLSIEATYQNDEPVGPAKLYHTCGALKEERTYASNGSGEIEGPFVLYHPNGQVETRGTYKLGKASGPQTDYYADGTPQAEANMLDNEAQGPMVAYFAGPGKRVDIRVGMDKGQRHGPYVSYYASGKEHETGTYAHGKRTGQWRRYHPNGKLSLEQSYDEAGLQHGTNREYDDDGVLYYEATYERDLIRKYQYLNKAGKVVEQGSVGKGETAMRGHRTDGTPWFSGQYRNGLMHGDWKYTYRHGGPASVRRFRDDKNEGLQEEFHPNGKLRKRTYFVGGEAHGRYEQYAADGVLRQEGWYQRGQQHGPWREYYADGRLSEEYGYYNGEENGLRRSYTPTGKLWSETHMAFGIRQRITEYDSTGRVMNDVPLAAGATGYVLKYPSGKPRLDMKLACYADNGFQRYYPSGKPEASVTMRGGRREGAFRTYHANGQLAGEGQYERGVPAGEWKFYDEQGKLSTKGRYEEGEKEGEWTQYHPDGKVHSTENYRDNELHGLLRRFDPAGQLIYEKRYEADDIMAWRHLQPNGQPGAWQDLSSQQGTIRSYYANGQLAAEETYRNGLLDGRNRLYHSNGKLYRETETRDGLTAGPQRTYSADGKLVREVHYLHDEQHGLSRYFRPDGTLERTEKWVSGEQAGPTVYYNAQGRPERTEQYWNNYAYETR